MMLRHGMIAVLFGLILGAVGMGAQPLERAAGIARAIPVSQDAPAPAVRARFGIPTRDSAWWVPLASAAVPGYGQKLLGQNRFVGYLAVEAYALASHLSSRATFDRERRQYLGLAHDVARAFVPGNDRVGDWDYYEAMEKNIESGVYDRTPGTGQFSPEVNLNTFNGAVWLKARQLSTWPDVDVEPPHTSAPYITAVAYYAAHAVAPELRWTWHNAQLEWDLYRQTIRRANDSSRDARQYLAVIAVNHVLSMIDAFITLRLRGGVGASRSGYQLVGSLTIP